MSGAVEGFHRRARRLATAGAAALLVAAVPAAAQFTEELDETRPEAWAMRWFNAVATPTAFGVADTVAPGSFEIALEAGSIPSLSEEERRVGFAGTKVEDLNRSNLFGRPVLRIGLPAQLTLSAGWVPPLDFDGVEANLVSLALGRPLWKGDRARLGAQLFYLSGDLEGDITCPASEVAAGSDPVGNPFLCEEVSNDTMSIDSWGAELGFAWRAGETVELHLSGIWQRLDADFQVRARYDGFVDRNRLHHEGDDYGATAGIAWRASERWRLAGELFYSPLDVVRDPLGRGPSENDALLNVRALLAYRLR